MVIFDDLGSVASHLMDNNMTYVHMKSFQKPSFSSDFRSLAYMKTIHEPDQFSTFENRIRTLLRFCWGLKPGPCMF